jgi:hypothetical protein
VEGPASDELRARGGEIVAALEAGYKKALRELGRAERAYPGECHVTRMAIASKEQPAGVETAG